MTSSSPQRSGSAARLRECSDPRVQPIRLPKPPRGHSASSRTRTARTSDDLDTVPSRRRRSGCAQPDAHTQEHRHGRDAVRVRGRVRAVCHHRSRYRAPGQSRREDLRACDPAPLQLVRIDEDGHRHGVQLGDLGIVPGAVYVGMSRVRRSFPRRATCAAATHSTFASRLRASARNSAPSRTRRTAPTP